MHEAIPLAIPDPEYSGNAGSRKVLLDPGARGLLSPREREVLTWVVKGLRNREIAQTLGISIKTIEFHRAQIMRKTGSSTAAELVRRAVLAGGSGIVQLSCIDGLNRPVQEPSR